MISLEPAIPPALNSQSSRGEGVGVFVISELILDSRSDQLTAGLPFDFCFLVQTREMLYVYKGILSLLQHPSSFILHAIAILLRTQCSSCFKTQNTNVGHSPQFLQLPVGPICDLLTYCHISACCRPL